MAANDYKASAMIKVFVGKHKEPFMIPKSILIANSEYFAAALKGNWKEGKEREVHLDEDDHEAFGLHTHWLYTQKIEGHWILFKSPAWNLEPFFLADKLMSRDFCNALIDRSIQYVIGLEEDEDDDDDEDDGDDEDDDDADSVYEHVPRKIEARENMARAANIVWQRTCPGFKLREMLLDHFLKWTPKKFQQVEAILSQVCAMSIVAHFALHLGKSTVDESRPHSPWALESTKQSNICIRYHDHRPGEPKCVWPKKAKTPAKQR